MIILTDFLGFTVNEEKLLRFWSKFENDKNFLILFHSSRKHLQIMFTFKFDHFGWLSQSSSEWRLTSKSVIFKISAKVSGQNLIMTKLFNFVPFIKKTFVNQVCILISSFSLTFTVSQWMMTNFKMSQFSRFLLRSVYSIYFKFWKWLKLLNSVPFIKKTLVIHLYIQIWSFWLTFTVLQWTKTSFKISQFEDFC